MPQPVVGRQWRARGLPLVPGHIFPRPYIEPGILYRLDFDASGACVDIELLIPHAEAAA